jgi:cellulose synthase/poly-beta-1,6-N-acetylglucosamine synthase-like glycosyltransferase
MQVGYTYFGYPAFLAVYALFRKKPFGTASNTPSVSIIIAARNEENNLPAKLDNLRALNYPPECIQVIVASDGSTDGTIGIMHENAPFVIAVVLTESHGKAIALNKAVEKATGEILVFQDARQVVDPNSVAELAACFADPSIGAVSGELLLETADSPSQSSALGVYWRLEKVIRKLESATGSVVGVTGALYAIRRELFTAMPEGTILDDVFVPMYVVRRGRRVIFQPKAIAHDRIFNENGREFARKVRTLTGNYQLLRLAPWLVSVRNPLLFRFVSHKLLRLLVPMSLVLALISSGLAGGAFYRLALLAQLLFYCLAAIGRLNPPSKQLKLVSVANTFVMLNVAAAMAFYNFVSGREKVWV